MTTAHHAKQTMRNRADRPVAAIAISALVGMLLGATPGAILVLLAQFVVDGEMQLTIGAPGILLGVVGAVAGVVVASLRAMRHRAS